MYECEMFEKQNQFEIGVEWKSNLEIDFYRKRKYIDVAL